MIEPAVLGDMRAQNSKANADARFHEQPFLTRIGDGSKRVGQWLWRGRLVWGAVFSLLLVPVACALIFEDRELQIRYSGLAFELLGLWLVVRGIRETRLTVQETVPACICGGVVEVMATMASRR
jgi:hypothetical protein